MTRRLLATVALCVGATVTYAGHSPAASPVLQAMQQELARARVLGPHGDAHQADPRIHAVGRDVQHGPVGALRAFDVAQACERAGTQPVDRD